MESRVQEHCLYRMDLFSSLGTEVTASEELVRGLEWFVCSIYGHPRILSVNEARKKAFWNKFNKEKDHRPKCDATMQVKSSLSHHES